MSDKKNKIEKDKKKSLKEQAIDKTATEGEKINHQVNDKRDHHQPRDTA